MAANRTYRLFEAINDIDVSETDIWEFEPDVLNHLLIDHTMSAKIRKEANDITKYANIFWATNDYSGRNEGYRYDDQIMPERIVAQNGRVVMPRVLKDKQRQDARVKDKAEVFTPSWVCNAQNNLVDNAWFGRNGVFNTEFIDANGIHSWTPTEGKIIFPEGDKQKTWQKYISENRMEITCGEGPYLVSRYDSTTGVCIPIKCRVGMLDRKLRVVGENTNTPSEWLKMARKAYEHTYGYEWQGDNLLLAREALLYTFIEYYIDKFNKKDADGKIILNRIPDKKSIIGIAHIISWNLWQMDGIRMVIPGSCDKVFTVGLFGDKEKQECIACKDGDQIGHIGIQCLIRDWNLKRPKGWTPKPGEDPKSSPWQKIQFSTLFHGNPCGLR